MTPQEKLKEIKDLSTLTNWNEVIEEEQVDWLIARIEQLENVLGFYANEMMAKSCWDNSLAKTTLSTAPSFDSDQNKQKEKNEKS